MQRGPKPSAQSLDTAFNEGFLAGASFAWHEVGTGLTDARERISCKTRRLRSENQRLSGSSREAA